MCVAQATTCRTIHAALELHHCRPMPRSTTQTRRVFLALILFLASTTRIALAQSGPSLAWDEDPSSHITGFAVTIDGVRTDYGVPPEQPDGTCGCSVPLPFSSGRHSVVVSAYNESGETASAVLIVGPTANAGGPYAGQAGVPLSVSGAGSIEATG